MNWTNLSDWLLKEQENPAPPMDNFMGSDPNSLPPESDQKTTQLGVTQPQNPMDKPVPEFEEPSSPDLPKQIENMDFAAWRNKFFRESIKNDVNALLNMINSIRDKQLSTYQRKFVEDNLQVCFLRQNANIARASVEMRKKIRDDIDTANPSTSIVNHFNTVLSAAPELVNTFIKISGLYSNKADLHRKYIASLLGAIQVGSGGQQEDLVYNEKTYSMKISTRFNSKFGAVDLGRWALQQDDPQKYLSDSELEKLESGAPEEKKVLRHRIIIESVASYFSKRLYLVNILAENGTIYFIGFDLANLLRSGYENGAFVVSTFQNDSSEALFNPEGEITTLMDIKIQFQKEVGEMDENGMPLKEKTEFLSKKDGMIFLNATLDTLKEASNVVNGLLVKEIPYNGNPSDLVTLIRCVPSASELILRNC